MLQPKPGSVTTVNMEIIQEKDKANLKEFDDLLSKVSRGKTGLNNVIPALPAKLHDILFAGLMKSAAL